MTGDGGTPIAAVGVRSSVFGKLTTSQITAVSQDSTTRSSSGVLPRTQPTGYAVI